VLALQEIWRSMTVFRDSPKNVAMAQHFGFFFVAQRL
jgi:hypothetical protein